MKFFSRAYREPFVLLASCHPREYMRTVGRIRSWKLFEHTRRMCRTYLMPMFILHFYVENWSSNFERLLEECSLDFIDKQQTYEERVFSERARTIEHSSTLNWNYANAGSVIIVYGKRGRIGENKEEEDGSNGWIEHTSHAGETCKFVSRDEARSIFIESIRPIPYFAVLLQDNHSRMFNYGNHIWSTRGACQCLKVFKFTLENTLNVISKCKYLIDPFRKYSRRGCNLNLTL